MWNFLWIFLHRVMLPADSKFYFLLFNVVLLYDTCTQYRILQNQWEEASLSCSPSQSESFYCSTVECFCCMRFVDTLAKKVLFFPSYFISWVLSWMSVEFYKLFFSLWRYSFSFFSLLMISLTLPFKNMKPTLYFWNKSNLILMY